MSDEKVEAVIRPLTLSDILNFKLKTNDIYKQELTNVSVRGMVFTEKMVLPAKAIGCKFIECIFLGYDYPFRHTISCDFDGSHLKVIPQHMLGCSYKDATFEGDSWQIGSYDGCNFDGAVFNSSTRKGSTFRGCSLKRVKFIECDFEDSKILGCNLRGAVFPECKFENTLVQPSDMTEEEFIEVAANYGSVNGLITKYTRAHT